MSGHPPLRTAAQNLAETSRGGADLADPLLPQRGGAQEKLRGMDVIL